MAKGLTLNQTTLMSVCTANVRYRRANVHYYLLLSDHFNWDSLSNLLTSFTSRGIA
jgi:hypothetical protein